jgi:hypothetical protein
VNQLLIVHVRHYRNVSLEKYTYIPNKKNVETQDRCEAQVEVGGREVWRVDRPGGWVC